jgi:organic radical activating enzyme
MEPLDHRALYRLPWNLADNPIAWLEPTQACNLACDGCYRQNVRDHKPVDAVQQDLETFRRLRNFDGISIAGGDPLMHPDLPEIIRRVAAMGRKPIMNTNGLSLELEYLRELRRAGLVGITFHIDSRQGRPGWRDKNEKDLNALREQYAEMVASVGGIACAFNATVYEETLHEVPDVVEWGARHIDKVHTLVFITYRAAADGQYEYYSGGKRIDMDPLVYAVGETKRRIDITSPEVVRVIQSRFPEFRPAAYLNGTEKPDSYKWLVALRAGTRDRIHGYVGPKFFEATQAGYHLIVGRYLGYAPPWTLGIGRTLLATAWPFDRGLRAASAAWARSLLLRPFDALKKVHLQAVTVIQPIDLLADGRQNMCDGCPDMTVWDGRLVWSCRLEELRHFGRFVTTTPKNGDPAGCRTSPR